MYMHAHTWMNVAESFSFTYIRFDVHKKLYTNIAMCTMIMSSVGN